MESSGQKLIASWRIFLLGILYGAGLLFLATALHRVQVVESHLFSRDLTRQSVRRVQVPGARGRIFDRNGICLADNRASYCIAYYVEELRKRGKWINTINAVDADIDRLSAVLGLPRTLSRESVSNHVLRSLPMPLLAWRDVNQETLARWAESKEPFPGVDVFVQPERYYPQGTLASHILGYIRRDRPKALPGQRVHFYLPEMVGRAGIEAYYNTFLTGTCGERLIQVDSRGYKHAIWEGEKQVAAGKDLHLTLDVNVQKVLERILRGWRGAGVVVDPRNGEILALASAPIYDPNAFTPILSPGIWKRLSTDPARPLLNRAIQGRYAPGSTFKPITALGALEKGFASDTVFDCTGTFTLGKMRLRCWDIYGHGEITLQKAIEQSCNFYFCAIGNTIGYEPIYHEADKLGIGHATGIDLPNEVSGLLPTEEWKRNRLRDDWRPGDTCHIAIGQGLLLTTPLQMAMATSAIANRGTLYRPHLNRAFPPEKVREMGWRPENIALVREGMHDVATIGTGKRILVRGLDVAAKTGTAEVDIGGVRRKNTWITAFAPFDNPTVTLAIMVEDGTSGGLTVAPMAHDILVSIFGEAPETSEKEEPDPEPAVREEIVPDDPDTPTIPDTPDNPETPEPEEAV